MKFCPVCRYYLYLQTQYEDNKDDILRRICRNCGYQEEDKIGGLILETDLKERTSEGYKILLNEFTKDDPTLPHTDSIKCPTDTCASNLSAAAKKDVIYLKYDPVNLKFLYICNICDTQWKSKGS